MVVVSKPILVINLKPKPRLINSGIPVPMKWNQIWIFKFQYWYNRARISMFKFQSKEPELGHSKSGNRNLLVASD